LNGSNQQGNMLTVCHVCNQAKQGRIFDSVEQCREWLHSAYWNSGRKRWVAHRAIAFGGKPPAGWSPKRRDRRGAVDPELYVGLYVPTETDLEGI
jgi:hypothetical protein